MAADLKKLSNVLQGFAKENLSDILHFTAFGLKESYKCTMVRVYLEDLYEGMLICQYVTGEDQPHEHQILHYISPKESIISQAFFNNEPVASWDLPEDFDSYRNPFEINANIHSSLVLPIVYQLRPIGTISLDWETEGAHLNPAQIEEISAFLSLNSMVIEKAKRFHQKISFSKHLDLARKREAAWRMVRSAVNLIDKLTLASALVPSSTQSPQTESLETQDQIQVLSVFSKNEKDADVYHSKGLMSISKGKNLINRILKYDKKKGLVVRNLNQKAVYIHDVREEKFERKDIASKIDLVSLYQIPKFNPTTGQFICAVNYYTNAPYEFKDSEKRLLEEHATMVEKLILEESLAHIEIEVLSEIEELLSGQDDSLHHFLVKILDKTSELIGADCGTISILRTVNGLSWLMVEDENGNPAGAKSRGWKKSKIPPLKVGGAELLEDLKSLNGYCAHQAKPILVNDIQNTLLTQGFYKGLSPKIRSELAVPIISGNSVLGVINQDSFKKNFFNEEHKNILSIIARLISQKVYNLKQIEELRGEMTEMSRDIEYRDPKVSSYYFGNVIGKSRKINTLVSQINTVVESMCHQMLQWDRGDHPGNLMGLPAMLITGETGTGKEFFFNNIFSLITEIFQKTRGADHKLPLKKTNIAAYSGELTYSELFGHKKGAFTGADSHRQGILEEANGGVVFLDEIGDADPKTQVQLLRFLDTGVFMRLGENEPRHSRIFLIAATNKNLAEEIKKGTFREDLFHRLNALSFHIPPLNERREDIDDLATHYLGRLFQTYKKDLPKDAPPPALSREAVEYLKNYHYTGNVRELKNILMRATLFSQGNAVTVQDIMTATRTEEPAGRPRNQKQVDENGGGVLEILETLEKGEGDFWTHIRRPFRDKEMTRDTLRSLITQAKNRYQTNLPGLAVKLRACSPDFRSDGEEKKKFASFKNFLYKTAKITEN